MFCGASAHFQSIHRLARPIGSWRQPRKTIIYPRQSFAKMKSRIDICFQAPMIKPTNGNFTSIRWLTALELDSARNIIAGSEQALCDAIRRGADLRIGTEFRHNEHIDVASDSNELIREVAEFGVTYLLQDNWAAGIMSLRQPVNLPTGFGPRSSMSYFLYNQNGQQAIARLHLDGQPANGTPGASTLEQEAGMPKFRCQSNWDAETNAPIRNFIYDFDVYRFCVSDTWQEVLSHDADGNVLSGSVEALGDAFAGGCEVKVGVRDLCADFGSEVSHEVFVQVGSCYYYTDRNLFLAGSHPLIRVRPAVPMLYGSNGWDSGWLVVHTDGTVDYRRLDPYTLKFTDHHSRHAIRWFVR